MDYTALQRRFAEKGCNLLTTNDEITAILGTKKSIAHLKLKFTSKCGHDSEGYLTNLLTKGTGINCRTCVNKIKGQKMRDNIQNGNPSGHELEFQGYTYLKGILEKQFEVKKTNEGCLADFVLRPLGIETDEWLMIQLKTTSKPTFGAYGFGINGNNYEKCVVAMVCVEDNKTWLIDGEMTKDLKAKLTISLGKSKYDIYEVKENILDVSLSFYQNKELFSLEACLCPSSQSQQQEQQYRRIIFQEMPFLMCIIPEEEGLKCDFQINGKKIQEKVCSIVTKPNGKKWYMAALYTNNGKIYGKRQYKPYMKGDNDLYWIWIKDERCFYIIPEDALASRNLVDDNNKTSSTRAYMTFILDDTTQWYSVFKFDLDNLDKEKLSNVFQ